MLAAGMGSFLSWFCGQTPEDPHGTGVAGTTAAVVFRFGVNDRGILAHLPRRE
jgi:hypothetical protein